MKTYGREDFPCPSTELQESHVSEQNPGLLAEFVLQATTGKERDAIGTYMKKIFGFQEWKPTRVFGSVMPSEPVALQQGLTKFEIEDQALLREARHHRRSALTSRPPQGLYRSDKAVATARSPKRKHRFLP